MWSHQIRLSSVKSRWKSHTVGPGNIPRTPPPNLCWSSAECCHISVSLMRLKLSTSFTYSALIGVFFLFFLPSLSLPLCRRTVKYISTSAASPCMIFFFPFSSPESLSKFYCRDFSRAVVLHFPFSVLDGSGKQLRASVSQGRQKIKNDRLSSGCLSCASENVCSSDCILSCPRGWKWVLLLQYLRDQCPAKFSTFSMRANRDLIKVTAAFR